MIYESIISPGKGLGNSIKLGGSMYEIIQHLDKFKYKFRISYNPTKFYENPIIVTIIDLNIRLTFNNQRDQTLELIEVLDMNRSGGGGGGGETGGGLRLIYNGHNLNEVEMPVNGLETTLSSASTVGTENSGGNNNNSGISSLTSSRSTYNTQLSSIGPNFKLIYNKIFGPTYPGKLNGAKDGYILSYPGISFKFRILNEELLNNIRDLGDERQQVLSALLNWDNPYDVTCDSIALHKGNSWEDYVANRTNERGGGDGGNEIENVVINLDEGTITIQKADKKENIIQIGKSTQQDVINILGPPEDYFNKFDSRLLIHNHLSNIERENSENDISHCKFHNYYKYGIDILYNITNSNNQNKMNNSVKKVIIHNGGITEGLNFMRWNRCNWEIESSDGSIQFNSRMYFDELPQIFHENTTPVLLNRNESEFIDNDLDIIESPNRGEDGMEMERDRLADDEQVKTWGQSKLYGIDRCILEVINSNGCISSVTIY
ncbi:uncharacterized protein J8A68_004751 [[Candida] subhashii]|uniref:Uncharacterized protein n=1 Tax=[Candida] subhashii TaxID=561895 RepID=A0A8J5QGN5_9ASCO|nr:uncharacterized protein J8A68_004751 [[Candida] subhashii]KAG7661693.1 hypothetical protein J8A68_004751 [[Candida] subhashii]